MPVRKCILRKVSLFVNVDREFEISIVNNSNSLSNQVFSKLDNQKGVDPCQPHPSSNAGMEDIHQTGNTNWSVVKYEMSSVLMCCVYWQV